MWPNLQFPLDLVKLTDEIPNGNLHFLRSEENFTFRLTLEYT